MKLLLLYATLGCSSIGAMEEFNAIKALLDNPPQLKVYLESQDQHSRTPLMRFIDGGTDEMIQELLPLLKDCDFNKEIPGTSGETAFYNACDRSTIVTVQELMRLGANPNPKAPAGQPVFLAYYNGNLPLLEFLLLEGLSPKIPHDVLAAASKHPNFARFKSLSVTERLP